MKHILLPILLITSILMSLESLGQQRFKERSERIESLKVGFITQKLDLSPDEAAIFWPLYNEMTDKIMTLKRQDRKDNADLENLDKAKANELLLANINREQQMLDIKKSAYLELSESISAKKVLALAMAEEQFRKELLREVRKRK